METEHLTARIDADISGFRRGLGEAVQALGGAGRRIEAQVASVDAAVGRLGAGLGERGAAAAEAIEEAFRPVRDAIAGAFEQLIRTGEVNFSRLIGRLARSLARLGLDAIVKAVAGGSGGGGVLGALTGRAAGGPVAPNTAYLVGERGPELFVPQRAGRIAPAERAGAPMITVHVNTPDAQSFLNSEAQIAALLARAVMRGARKI